MVFDRPPSLTDHHSRGRKRTADDVWEGTGAAAGGANKRTAPEPGRRSQDGGFTRGLSTSSSISRSSRLTSKDIWHGQVCKVYASYSRLLRSSSKTDAGGDGQTPLPSAEDLQDFQRILGAASPEGSCASRRLASRLVPKFVPQFPTLVDACATALITLHQGRWHPESLAPTVDGEQQRQQEQQQQDIIRATREDALTGLGEVLHASMRLVDRAVPTVLRIVDFLFRQLHACTSAAAEAAAQPPSLKRSDQQANSPSPEPLIPTPASSSNNSTLAIIQEVLKLAFKLYPRVVLSCCLQSFKGQDRMMFQAATCFCKHTLLADSSRAPALAAAATARGAAAAAGGGGGSSKEGTPGDTPGDGAAAKPPTRPCLAQEVLAELPDTQQWLRQAIASIAKDKKVLSAKECHPHIDRLLKLSAPASSHSTSPHPPEPPSSFTGMSSVSLGVAAWSSTPSNSKGHPAPSPSASVGRGTGVAGAAGGGLGGGRRAGAQVWDDFVPEIPGRGPAGDLRRGGSVGGSIAGVAAATVAASMAVPPSKGALAQGLASPSSVAQQQQQQQQQQRSITPDIPPLPPPSPSQTHTNQIHRSASQVNSSAAAPPPLATSTTAPQQGARPPPPLPQPLPTVLTPVAIRGGPICRADSCLYLGNLPVALGEAGLRAECTKQGVTVDSLHIGPAAQLQPGEAFAVFSSVKNAAIFAEATAQQKPFGGSRPLVVEFCPGLPLNCPARTRAGPLRPASSLVWCSGLIQPTEIMGALRNAQTATPTALLKVAGHMPGFLLDMPQPECCQHVIDSLLAYFYPHGDVCSAPHLVPIPLRQAADRAVAAAAAPPPMPPTQASTLQSASSTPIPSLKSPSAAGPTQHTSSTSTSGLWSQPVPSSSALQQQQQQQQQGNPTARTLWVGQIHSSVSEDQLLRCFRRYGDIVSHCVIRNSSCAFIDFLTHASAAEAKRALAGTPLGQPPQPIRVEWRSESKGHHPPKAPPPHTPVPTHTTTSSTVTAAATTSRPLHTPHTPPLPTPLTIPTSHAPFPSPIGNTPHPPLPFPHLSARSPYTPHSASATTAATPRSASDSALHLVHGGHAFSGRQSPGQGPYPPTSHPPPTPLSAQLPPAFAPHPHSKPHPPSGLPPPAPPHPQQHNATSTTPRAAAPQVLPHAQQHHHQPHQLPRQISMVGAGPGPGQATDVSASAAAAAAAAAVAARLQGGSGSRRAAWGGVLAKSGAPVCSMVCWEGPSASTGSEARGASGGFDPRAWPRTLDVRMRVDVHYVVNTVFAAAAPDARAVRWLHPMPGASTPEDEARLAEFSAYLAGKGRAGVIKLDPSHSQPPPSEGQCGTTAAAARCGPLALYLVPPSSPVCGALGVPWDGQQQQQLRQHGGRGVPPLLLALVVPQQAAPTGS